MLIFPMRDLLECEQQRALIAGVDSNQGIYLCLLLSTDLAPWAPSEGRNLGDMTISFKLVIGIIIQYDWYLSVYGSTLAPIAATCEQRPRVRESRSL